MPKTNSLIIILFFISTTSISAQSIFGKWQTVDDRNGVVKGIINVYEEEGAMYAYVEKILEKGKKGALCAKCKGERKDKPIEGMMIMDSLTKNKNDVYTGKTLFDPEQAMTFRCKVWLDPENSNKLKVRGYLAFIYRTQTWLRVIEE